MNLFEEYSLIKDEIISARREIHKKPELGFNEFNTGDIICNLLDKYSIDYKRNIAKTGVVATVGTNKKRVLLIRADMDALPVQEKTELPFASVNKGIMHACGHDIHVASVLATAIILKKHEKLLGGTVKFVFQPAEETTGGAEPMINEGIMHNPDVTAAIGGHITLDTDVKKFKVKSGALMASPDDFMIKFIGKSTHGAEPQNGISPILPACDFVLESKKISKNLCCGKNDVLSMCTISANGGINTIPDEAFILGTFRSFDESSRQTACKMLKETAELTAKKYNVKCEYNYNFLYPPLLNDENMTNKFINIANTLYGDNSVEILNKPFMTGDDFSYFGKEVPAVYFWYGGKKDKVTSLHSSEFDANEDAIEACASVFIKFALDYLE